MADTRCWPYDLVGIPTCRMPTSLKGANTSVRALRVRVSSPLPSWFPEELRKLCDYVSGREEEADLLNLAAAEG